MKTKQNIRRIFCPNLNFLRVPVSVLEGLVADGAVDGPLHAVHRLEVAAVHAADHLKGRGGGLCVGHGS